MRKALVLFLFLLAIAFLQGCGVHMHDRPTASLVYGAIDMDEAPCDLDWATMKQYKPKPKDDKPYWYGATADGTFWFDALQPGSYQLVTFGGSSWWRNASFNFQMPEFEKNDTAVVISKPGLYFVGSYKYRKTGSFWKPSFEMERIQKPTELELLTKLLPYSTGTQWEAKIKKRMEQLR